MNAFCLECGSERCVYDDLSIAAPATEPVDVEDEAA